MLKEFFDNEKEIRWIIQNNIINENDLTKLRKALKRYYVQEVKVIPFSNELPLFSTDSDIINIYYGSTTFIYNIYNKLKNQEGLFLNESFTMENYISHWKGHMLNNVQVRTFGEFVNENWLDNEVFFIKPNKDDKCFSGGLLSFGEIKQWYNSFKDLELPDLNSNTKILVACPKVISKEWRCVIVNGKVIESSLYQENSILKKNRNDKPEEMIRFTEDRCQEHTPHNIFVMDIALVNNKYKIIECNCFNGSGFYDCDIKTIVDHVSYEMVKKK